MKLVRISAVRLLSVAGFLVGALAAQGQAPTGSTGQCNDGSYTSAAKKWQACRGHQGVKSWFGDAGKGASASTAATSASAPAQAAPASTPAATSAPPSTASTAPASGKRISPGERAAATPQAPGGGPGMVWVNTDTKVYHCSGTTFYGKTKAGKYMSEADAKASGARPDRGKACSK